MSLQILEKRMAPAGNDLKRFKIAAREVGHLEQLVNDVLIYAKPADPRTELADMGAVLDHALDMAAAVIADKKIAVSKGYKNDQSRIVVDPAMLGQAFLNVIYNAVDAMEEGGKLTLSAFRSDSGQSAIVVEIEDNGCGIDEEDMSSLYNPFFTTKQYGTGLGLAQVKKIIDLHQGAIDIASVRGRGTKVIMSFPCCEKKQDNHGPANLSAVSDACKD
jgi:signal transduction histidine kinase